MKLFQRKSDQQVIEEIHNEFDTAHDRLYDYAMQIINDCGMHDTKKAELLKKHGFTSNKLVVDYEKNFGIKSMSEQEANVIQHYKRTYPFLKFLTEQELDRICDKYGLVYAPVANYKMPVPEKNLLDIENAQQLSRLDAPSNTFITKISYSGILNVGEITARIMGLPRIINERFQGFSDADRYLKTLFPSLSNRQYICDFDGCFEINKQGIFIAAPKKHFNLNGLKFDSKKGFYNFSIQEVKDPIVFRYVKGGIQVITKWGLEGEDPALQNEILN